MTSYLVLMSVIFCPRHMSPHLVLRTHKPWTKDQFIGELEFNFLAKVICRLSILWQKRAQLTDAREHTGRNWNLRGESYFLRWLYIKIIPKMKLLKLFSRWIVSYICILNMISFPHQRCKKHVPQVFGRVQMGDCHWLRRIQFRKGSDWFNYKRRQKTWQREGAHKSGWRGNRPGSFEHSSMGMLNWQHQTP